MGAKRDIDDDLLALAQMGDDEIDTSDIPETLDFSQAQRGRFYPLAQKGYDVRAIANWCVYRSRSKGRTPTSLWLNKLVYLICETAVREYRELLTPAKIEAWQYGPVFREIYFQTDTEVIAPFTKFNARMRVREIAQDHFDARDIALFDRVWERYGNMPAGRLTDITHQPGTPWHKVWYHGGRTNPGMEIDPLTILGCVDSQFDERN